MRRKISGIILILLAAASILVSFFLVIEVWRVKTPVTNSLVTSLDLISSTLNTTSQGLVIAQSSLATTTNSVKTLRSTVQFLGKSMDDTTPLLTSLEQVTGEDMPTMIEKMQTSLATAQSSARVIDSVLVTLTAIPFFPGDPYSPEVPLADSLGEISNSISDLPDSFRTMQRSLKATRGNIVTIKADVSVIASDLEQISSSLDDAQGIIQQYQQAVSQIQAGVAQIQTRLPGWANTAAWVLTFIFVWMAVAQWGILSEGLENLGIGLPENKA